MPSRDADAGEAVRVADLLNTLERLAPAALAQPWDNSGLLVGDPAAEVRRVLAALELTDAVLAEAVAGGYNTVLTHHPLLFDPVRSLVESRPREKLLRRLVEKGMSLVTCHTNLDAAPGGLAEIAGEALGLREMAPMESAPDGWYKLVGFVPPEAVEKVAAAVFAAGAGVIGDYQDCAFSAEGTGWFTAQPGSHPAVGEVSRPERTPELRWETVVPRGRVAAVVRAFVEAHPYEEPAFDIYPVEDVLPRVGLGRVGTLPQPAMVRELAERAVELFEVGAARWSGDGARRVERVAVLPGSGHGMLEAAAGQCEALITGDLSYHGADEAAERGVSVIDVPHGDFEWWAFRRWGKRLGQELNVSGVELSLSQAWRSPWTATGCAAAQAAPATSERTTADDRPRTGRLRIWIDGGSRGNPGPSAIGVVIEDGEGRVVEEISRAIGVETNNVAEYRALLAGLEAAAKLGARDVDVASDSELLVKQMRGEYKVKNAGLKPLQAEARQRAGSFASFLIRHVEREQNARADALVNKALDVAPMGSEGRESASAGSRAPDGGAPGLF
jgi:dinuclear metal center YbgI/SA1388 family protein